MLPLVGNVFGGPEHVRFQEFNIRVWPPGYGRGGMGVHHDAAVPARYSREAVRAQEPICTYIDNDMPQRFIIYWKERRMMVGVFAQTRS